MILAEALFAHLAADAGVSGLVADRIYPLLMPQRTGGAVADGYPAVVYESTGANFEDATTLDSKTVPFAVYRFSMFALDYPTAKRLQSRVIGALHGFAGTMPAAGSVVVKHLSVLSNGPDGVEFIDADVAIFSASSEFQVFYDLSSES